MNKGGSGNAVLGIFLLISLFSIIILSVLACMADEGGVAPIATLFSLPAYFAILYCSSRLFTPEKDNNSILYTSQSTVEGI